MKKYILSCILLTILLIVLPQIFGQTLNCQYIDYEEYQSTETALLYDDTQQVGGIVLQLSEFTNGSAATFNVFNPNGFPITAFFRFRTTGHGEGFKTEGIKINSSNSGTIRELCYNGTTIGVCEIINDSVSYYLTEPSAMRQGVIKVTKNKTICDKPCKYDSECATGICNIAGYCGNITVVPCPDNTLNCKNVACTKPKSKQFGETYSCAWECQSGVGSNGICLIIDGNRCNTASDCVSGICNIGWTCGANYTCPEGTQDCKGLACVPPSKTKEGQACLCDWECKSNFECKSVCVAPRSVVIKRWVLWILGLVTVITIIFLIIKKKGFETLKNQFKKVEEEKKRLEEEKIKLKEEITETENKIVLSNEIKDRVNKDIILRTDQLNKLEAQKRNAHGEARVAYERELNLVRQEKINDRNKLREEDLRQEKWRKHIKDKDRKLDEKDSELINKQIELDIKQKEFEKSNKDYEIKAAIDKYEKRYFNALYLDNKGYLRFKGSNELLHKYLYEENLGFAPGCFIHHIDADKLNDDLYNLIAIPIEEHKQFKHARVPSKDWDAGIHELREQLHKEDKDFHKFILKRLEQKKLKGPS